MSTVDCSWDMEKKNHIHLNHTLSPPQLTSPCVKMFLIPYRDKLWDFELWYYASEQVVVDKHDFLLVITVVFDC